MIKYFRMSNKTYDTKRRERFDLVLSYLYEALDDGTPLSIKAVELGFYKTYFINYRKRGFKSLKRDGIITPEQHEEFLSVYHQCSSGNNNNNNTGKQVVNEEVRDTTTTTLSQKEMRTKIHKKKKPTFEQYGEEVRNQNEQILVDNSWVGKILHYEYCVADGYGEPVRGEIMRPEMEKIYKYYSSLGGNLTRKGVALELCDKLKVDMRTFERILLVFGITKASIPLAPHQIEENTVDVNVQQSVMFKTKEIQKKINEQRYNAIEQEYKKLLVEVEKLREQTKFNSDWLKELNFTDVKPHIIVPNKKILRKEALIPYIADLHIGAMVEEDSLYSNPYDEEEIFNRMGKILLKIEELNELRGGVFDKIIINNLGDSLDGYDGKTTRGGHQLSQNMNNKQQFNTFVELMKWFFSELHDMEVANSIDYYAVGTSNHDGDFGYCANRTIIEYFNLKYPQMHTEIFERVIGHYHYGKHTFCITHGKDAKEMFRSLPLNLDDKTENFINSYLDNNSLYNDNIHFVKADLHQPSLNYGKRFRYKNVGSIFGSSKWIHHNFGNTKAYCDMDIVDFETEGITEIRIPLN